VYPGISTRVRRWTVLLAALALALAGCGGEEKAEEPAAAPATTPTPAATSTPEPVEAATSAEQCQELWNANARGGSAGQKAPEDYLAEVAPTGAFVDFVNGECVVVAPVKSGARKVYIWVARGGRAPYGHPSQDTVPAGRDLRFNAQATAEGKLE
jgi:hypothetical protein